MRKRVGWIVVGLVAGLVLGVGGLAVASIPDSGTGVFHGCVSKNGSLRLVDPSASGNAAACSNSEQAVTWNQTGPKGDPGEAGGKGDPGDPGASGISHIYATNIPVNGLITGIVSSSGLVEVAGLDVPAGTFAVTGKVVVDAFDNYPYCVLRTKVIGDSAFTKVDEAYAYAELGLDGFLSATLVVQSTITTTAPTRISIDCSVLRTLTTTAMSEVHNRHLVAIAVDAVN